MYKNTRFLKKIRLVINDRVLRMNMKGNGVCCVARPYEHEKRNYKLGGESWATLLGSADLL